MKRYLYPYKRFIVGSVVLNFVSQWLNVFSFVVLIPILNILFKIDTAVYEYKPWELDKDVIINNAYAFFQEMIDARGALLTLIVLAVSGV